jgi:hypothetical protein
MGWLPILKYLLSGVRGCLLQHLVVPGIKCHCFLRTRLCWCLFNAKSPRAWLPGARVCPEPVKRVWAEQTYGEILSAHVYRGGVSADADYTWV